MTTLPLQELSHPHDRSATRIITNDTELIAALSRAFISCDLDRSGTIDEIELGIALRAAGFEPTQEDVKVKSLAL